MRRTIAFVNTTALRTSARRITRVNRNYRDARKLRLVLEKCTELKKRPAPRMQAGSLVASNRNSLANATQVFQGNRATSALRDAKRDYLLADRVIDVLGKTGFLTRQLFEQSLCRARCFLLQFGAQTTMTKTDIVDGLARIHCPIRIHGEIHDTQVNTQDAFALNRFGLGNVTRRRQVALVAKQNQVRLTLPRLEEFTLFVTADKRNLVAPVRRSNRNLGLFHLPTQNAVIVSDCALRFEFTLVPFVQLVRIRNFSAAPHRHLRRQAKLFSHVLVNQFVQGVLIERFLFPCDRRDIVARAIRFLHRLLERGKLFRSSLQFDLGDQFHEPRIARMYTGVNSYVSLFGTLRCSDESFRRSHVLLCQHSSPLPTGSHGDPSKHAEFVRIPE